MGNEQTESAKTIIQIVVICRLCLCLCTLIEYADCEEHLPTTTDADGDCKQTEAAAAALDQTVPVPVEYNNGTAAIRLNFQTANIKLYRFKKKRR